MTKILGAVLLSMLLAACNTTSPTVPSGFNLPPRNQIVADTEPAPKVYTTDSQEVIALKFAGAFNRANVRLVDSATNYENLAGTLAAKR